jgi:hypothetical protein
LSSSISLAISGVIHLFVFGIIIGILQADIEHRAVICPFGLKGLSARDIAIEIASVYDLEAPAFPILKNWRRRFLLGRTALCDDPTAGRPFTNCLAEAMTSMLQETPFISCKILCRYIRRAKGACPQILQERLGMKMLHLCWVPRALDATDTAKRVRLSNELLTMLESDRSANFEHAIPENESWFCFYYPHDPAWAESREELVERIRQKLKPKMPYLDSMVG